MTGPTGISNVEDLRQRTIPVSYTHLDVYKRQAIAGAGSSSASFNIGQTPASKWNQKGVV